jgi:hypothetical protein
MLKRYHNATGDLTAPPGYKLVANEGQSRSFTAPTNLAYGANGKFAYLRGQMGIVTFDNATFGKDPIEKVVKGGFAEVTLANQQEVAAMNAGDSSAITKWLIYGGLGLGVIIAMIFIIRGKKKK